jgi:hypothetical protein
MANLCKTEPTDKWECTFKLSGNRFDFTVDQVYDRGFFRGRLFDLSTNEEFPIAGQCDGVKIYFCQPGAELLYYIGDFEGMVDLKNGRRRSLLGVEGKSDRDHKVLQDEEWEGGKVPT